MANLNTEGHLCATRANDDLGTPEGLNLTDYTHIENWKFERWRWEFIRRDDDFRKDSVALLELMNNCFTPCVCTCGPQKDACRYPGELERFREAWRYKDAVHPKEQWVDAPNGDHEQFVMNIIGSPIPAARMSIVPPGMHVGISLRDNEGQPRRLSDYEMVVKFDIDRPLPDQLKWAQVLLYEEQESKHGDRLQKRPRPDKWHKYLLMLDARERTSSEEEIAEILKMTVGTAHTIRDTIEQARKLQRDFRSDDYRLKDR